MQQIIMDYVIKKDETMEQALWSSGVYRKQDLRSFKDAAEGKSAAVYTLYDSAYLVNGRCHNCSLLGRHQPHCPGAHMKKIKNIVLPLCPVCNYCRLEGDRQFCYSCEEEADQCSCYTPDYCQARDYHDGAYYEKKRVEWKAKLAAAGIVTD